MITLSQKLRLILKISRLTQEKLAQKLQVSFVSLNTWVNEKAIPRKSTQAKIDELYFLYTGQSSIQNSVLQAKKDILQEKAKKYPSIFAYIKQNPDIYDQFLLSLTYNTNSIEGSTLTENETAILLFQNRSLPNKTMVEQLEAKNHQAAMNFLFRYLEGSNTQMDEDFILKLHSILMNGICEDAGIYRNHGVRIVGSNVPTANYVKIPVFMMALIEAIQSKEVDIFAAVSHIHAQFEKIHPFSDGNGRIGRLLMHAMLLQNNLPPVLIEQTEKNLYYTYLQKAQIQEDYSLLEDFICESIFKSFDILER